MGSRCRAWWLLATLVALGVIGCRNRTPLKPSPSAQNSAVGVGAAAPAEQLQLEGSFERVAKAVTGTACIVRHGNTYELVLRDVTVQQEGMVRVYLVGHQRPANTRILDETELKYDMAELDRVNSEQRIELPSEPDPALRSVVLYYPAFGANLAFAPLRPPMNARK